MHKYILNSLADTPETMAYYINRPEMLRYTYSIQRNISDFRYRRHTFMRSYCIKRSSSFGLNINSYLAFNLSESTNLVRAFEFDDIKESDEFNTMKHLIMLNKYNKRKRVALQLLCSILSNNK